MRVRCGIPAAQDRRKIGGVLSFALGGGGLKEGASWGGAGGEGKVGADGLGLDSGTPAGPRRCGHAEGTGGAAANSASWLMAVACNGLLSFRGGGCSKAIWVQKQGWIKHGHCCNGLIVVADLGLALPARAGRQHGCWAAWWCWCALEAGAWWRRRRRTSAGHMTTTARRLVRALATMTGPLLCGRDPASLPLPPLSEGCYRGLCSADRRRDQYTQVGRNNSLFCTPDHHLQRDRG